MATTANKDNWNFVCLHCENDSGKKIAKYEKKCQEFSQVICGKCKGSSIIRFEPNGMTTTFKAE